MILSIQQFERTGIKKLEKVIEKFLQDPTNMAAFVQGIQTEVIALGLDLIKETLEDCNRMLLDSGKRKTEWAVVRADPKKLITSLGTVQFEKTLFRNKTTGEGEYLLDRILGLRQNKESPKMPRQSCWKRRCSPLIAEAVRRSA